MNDNNDKIEAIIGRLKQKYPVSDCALEYDAEPWKLLIMARLSAQCTDARVNIVSLDLFSRFKSIEDFANADFEELERAIFSCGLHRTKARDIIGMCKMLIGDFNSQVPDKMEDLLKLPGIGRKIANLILGDIFGKPAIVADTHCIRIAGRLGLCESPDPYKVETQLAAIVPPEESSDFCHRLVFFGRDICRARVPGCEKCFLGDLCEYGERKRG